MPIYEAIDSSYFVKLFWLKWVDGVVDNSLNSYEFHPSDILGLLLDPVFDS